MSNIKYSIILTTILVLFITLLVSYNLIFSEKKQFYVQITKNGEEGVKKSIDGLAIGKAYIYKLTAFDNNGEEKQLKVRASKNLRKNAFLRVYYSDVEKTVESWEEVTEVKLPLKAKEKLERK
ncbi:YxeA family protein [Bacillus cereus group sp. BceL291]|uniref:YxeA family protein n=1 Tax=Bacillus cereus group TaxID=86661 RepID=UPI00286904CF|nr:YxeA family protein [Bacillus thuringiensis]